MTENLITLLQASTEYRIGRAIGSIFVGVVILLGVLKCAKISRREQTNSKAAIGLMLVLIGWLTYSLAGVLAREQPVNRLLLIGGGLVAFSLMMVGSTIAVLGLAEIRKDRHKYRQGSAQAKWALAITTWFLIVMGTTVFQRLRGQTAAPASPMAVLTQPDGNLESTEQFNFRIEDIPTGWVAMDAKRLNPQAVLAYSRVNPQAVFFAVAEEFGQTNLTQELLAEVSRANLTSAATAAELGALEEFTLNGLPGLGFSSVATVGTQVYSYRHWVGARNGFAYQLIMGADQRTTSQAQLEELAFEFFSGFRQIDPNRKSYVGRAPEQIASAIYGYQLDLTDGAWQLWDDLSSKAFEAELGALDLTGAAMVVIPVAFEQEPPAQEIIEAVLLDCFDFNREELATPVEVSQAGARGREFSAERGEAEERYHFRIRIVTKQRLTWVAAVWKRGGQADPEQLNELMSCIQISPRATAPDLDALEDSEAERLASVYFRIGKELNQRKQHLAALPYLRRAITWRPQIADYRTWLMNSMLRLEQYEDVVHESDAALELFPDDLVLRAYRPYSRSHLGQKEEAVAEFLEMFAGEYRDEDDLRLCAETLHELGRADAALELVTSFQQQGETERSQILLADLYEREGEYQKAHEILTAARQDRPLSTRLEWALLDNLWRTERHQEAISVLNGLLRVGQVDEDVIYRKAES